MSVQERERAGQPAAGEGGVITSPARMVGTLALAGAAAGLLLVLVHQWSQPRILAHQAATLRAAVEEVLGEPDRYETLFVHQGALTATVPPGVDTTTLERVYRGYDAGGRPVGYAITGAEPGFQDFIRLIFGYDPESGRVLGMKVLESKETPGLGDKIEKDTAFVGAFAGVAAPLEGVKAGAGHDGETEVDMITGATISSRTVIGIINHRLERVGPLLVDYERGGVAVTGRGRTAP